MRQQRVRLFFVNRVEIDTLQPRFPDELRRAFDIIDSETDAIARLEAALRQ